MSASARNRFLIELSELLDEHGIDIKYEGGFVLFNQQFSVSMDEIASFESMVNCNHNFVDARNEIVKSGEVCMNCGKMRATDGGD